MKRTNLGLADYAVISLMLFVSALIGVCARYFQRRKQTTKDFLMGDGNAAMFPVVLSIVVSMVSSIELLGSSEMYRYGTQKMVAIVGMMVGMMASTYIFIPVFFKSGVSTVHEFLVLRYGRKMQYTISGLFIMQMIFLMSAVIYGSVLALSAVTDLSMEISIVIIGVLCSFYCSLGGLKGVLWADVFQSGLIFVNVFIIYFIGIREAGGILEVYETARNGSRIEFLNFDFSLTTRYTFWNCLTRGLIGSLAFFGCSQLEVQRMLSLSSISRAKCSLLWSILPMVTVLTVCQIIGIILYSIFHYCDPVQDTERSGITRYDQLVPYYILSRMGAVPGLTGLCAAGIFSGALSTVSSALNSLSTVTVVDFLRPLWPLTERRTLLVARVLSVVYGLVCIGFSFAILNADSLMAVAGSVISMVEGPTLAVFLVGVLSRKGDEKCALFGLLVGVSVVAWIGFGSIFSRYAFPSLPLDTSQCSSENVTQGNITLSFSPEISSAIPTAFQKTIINEPFILYKISFMWMGQIGFAVTVGCIFLAAALTGWNKNAIPNDSKCLSPVTRLWRRKNRTNYNTTTEEEIREKLFPNGKDISTISFHNLKQSQV